MKQNRESTIERLLRVLNGDILREFHLAEACLHQASCLSEKHYPVVRRQIAMCAAAAMSNATALAGEVLGLGGIPVTPGCREEPPSSNAILTCAVSARAMLAHYKRQMRVAERAGLLRLREVLRQVASTKRQYLAHCDLITSGRLVDRYV
jgi:hypothetical protein